MNKKVLVLFRGSIGDACVWMTKFKGMFDRHYKDDIYFILNSRYDKNFTCNILSKNVDFFHYYNQHCDRITSTPYHMPSKVDTIRKNFGPHDYFYEFDVWDGKNNKWNPPASKMYEQLGYDVYPINLPDHRLKTIIIHPEGYHIKNTWKKENWDKLRQLYENKGYIVIFCGDKKENFFGINDLIDGIKHASLWIGVDTGTRNIALIHQTPVIELGTPGKGDPNMDVFHPIEYRWNSLYAPNINQITPEEIVKEGERKWNI